MRYSLHNIRHEAIDLDDDVIYFYYDILFTEPEELIAVNNLLPYSMLLVYIKAEHPEFYKFIKSVNASIDGYGPCEARTMDAMGDEGVTQLYTCLEEYLLTCDWMDKEFIRLKTIRSRTPDEQIKIQEQTEDAFEKLTELSSGFKNYQARYRHFCESLTKEIRKTALEIYPEITNLDSKQLLKFKNLFVNEVINIHKHIEQLITDKE